MAKETEHLVEVQKQAKSAEIDMLSSQLVGKQIIQDAEANAKSISEDILQKEKQRNDLDFAISIRESTLREYDESIEKQHYGTKEIYRLLSSVFSIN